MPCLGHPVIAIIMRLTHTTVVLKQLTVKFDLVCYVSLIQFFYKIFYLNVSRCL